MIKIKISMTCVYKEYEFKIKMVQEQWLQLKMKFFLGYNVKINLWGENKNLVEVGSLLGGIFSGGRDEQIFG